MYWIKELNSLTPNGYNTSRGGKNGANTRKVRNATTGKEYETITDASKDFGVTVEAIRMALDKENRKSEGFKWETIK